MQYLIAIELVFVAAYRAEPSQVCGFTVRIQIASAVAVTAPRHTLTNVKVPARIWVQSMDTEKRQCAKNNVKISTIVNVTKQWSLHV